MHTHALFRNPTILEIHWEVLKEVLLLRVQYDIRIFILNSRSFSKLGSKKKIKWYNEQIHITPYIFLEFQKKKQGNCSRRGRVCQGL